MERTVLEEVRGRRRRGEGEMEKRRALSEASASGSRSCPQLAELDAATTSGDSCATAVKRSAGVETGRSLKSYPLRNLDREERTPWKGISIGKVMVVAVVSMGGGVVYVGKRWNGLRWSPGFVGGFVTGLYYGLRFCRRYQKNRSVKMLQGRILGLPLGEKGLFQMVQSNDRPMPEMTASERVEYITRVLKLMWPFYIPNFCKWLVNFLTPMLQELKPQFIRNIRFLKFSLGDRPFTITEVRVVKESAEEFVIDTGVQWRSLDDSIDIEIELSTGRVLHFKFHGFVFYGNARIAFTPLVPYFPGFGAMTISLHSSPTVNFELDMKDRVLSLVAEQVRQFLSSFVTEHIFGTILVWPARIVIPILPKRFRGKLDHLELHTRGVLRVVVVEGSGLGSGESHNGFDTHVKPFVVLETVPLQPLTTKVLPDGHHPVWKEEHFLKVQELDQCLRVELFDDHYDPVMPSFTSAQRHGRKIGSVSIPLRDLPPGENIDRWFNLNGAVEDVNRPVRSKHHGQDLLSEMWYLDKRGVPDVRLRLHLTYMPVEELRQGRMFLERPWSWKSSSHYGLLFVRLLKAYNLPNVDYLSLSDPFCVLSLDGASSKRSMTVKDSLNPEWRENYEWFNVCEKDHLVIEVFSEGTVVDTPMGYIKIPVSNIANECERTVKVIDTILPLTDGIGDLHLELDWVPLDSNLAPKRSLERSRLKAVPRGHLFVKLLWAEDLPNVGFFGLSDPYCILKVKGYEQRSKVIKNSLSPVWSQEFSWESVQRRDRLEIDVWSKGTLQDTHLGTFKTQIDDAIEHEGIAYEVSHQPLIQISGQTHGTLVFQIYWKRIAPGSARSRNGPASPDWPEPSSRLPLVKKKSLKGFFLFSS